MPNYPKSDFALMGLPAPVADDLLKHADRYGLDNTHQKQYRGKPTVYTTYRKLRNDALVEVARVTQTLRSYLAVVEGLGYRKFKDAAEADWKAHHEEETE